MLLLNDGNSAATAGNNDLICGCQSTDGFDLHDVDGLGSSNDTTEAFTGIFLDIIALFHFDLGVLFGHVTANDLGGLIESLVIRVYGYLGEDGADRLGDTAVQQLCPERVLDIVAHITLTHSGADTHRCGV